MIPSSAELRRRLKRDGDMDPLRPHEWASLVQLLEILEEIGHSYDGNISPRQQPQVDTTPRSVYSADAEAWWAAEMSMQKFLSCDHVHKILHFYSMSSGICRDCGHTFTVKVGALGNDTYNWN